MTKAKYGLDAPKVTRNLFLFGIFSGVLSALAFLAISNRAIALVLGIIFAFTGFCLLITGLLMVFSSSVGKLKEREKILDALNLYGNEEILDVGCGRGLYLIGAAKRLMKGGHATGIDIWQNDDLSNNSQQNTLNNALYEGVSERVRVETADMRKIPYENESFDVVLSCLAIHNIYEEIEREKALLEIIRVLKSGGALCIIDLSHVREYIEISEANGISIKKTKRLNLVFPKSIAVIGTKE